ncbi:MAG: hypothetical protein MUP67_05410 [Acidimicrobiia bacterium]|nr:hypothetical protein [Acidimicrobiia bacterium]
MSHTLALGPGVLGGAALGVSAVGWIVRGVVAVLAMLLIYVIGAGILKKFKVAPDEEVDPEAVVPVNIAYVCIVCGAEVVMTAAQGGEEPDAPRHCREDMVRLA